MYIHKWYYSRGKRILQDLHCINISSFFRKNWSFCAQHPRVAHALLCAVHFVLPKADADEGTAAVTGHDRDGQRHHIVSMGFVRRPPPVPCIIKRKESVSEL